MARLVALLPCYNEGQALPALLIRFDELRRALLPGHELSVLVVDDGSRDGTAASAQGWVGELPVELVQHERNLGLGAALNTGVRHFLASTDGASDAMLAVMDADGTHPPALLSRMLDAAAGNSLDVVIASRYAIGGAEFGLPPLRRIYSRAASLALRMIAPVSGARDYTCGYRLYRRSILAQAAERFGDSLITERSFVCMAELLVKLGRVGARVGEVPLELHYELKGGVSKMNVAATIRRYAVFAFRALFDPRFR